VRMSLYEELALDRERARHARLKAEQTRMEPLSLRADLAAVRMELAYIELQRALRRKYDPNQPRVPAGNPDGGRWTSEGGGQGANGEPTDVDITGSTGRTRAPENENERRYTVNLEEEDARGGHAMRDHVGKTEAELSEELDKDWKRWETGRLQITNYRPAQGSFSSLIEANDFVTRRFGRTGKRSTQSQQAKRNEPPLRSGLGM
jgi:hypothetical protein